jgi:hypothetical protein
MNQPTITIEDAITFSVLHRLPEFEWLNPEWQTAQDEAEAEAIAKMPNPFRAGERPILDLQPLSEADLAHRDHGWFWNENPPYEPDVPPDYPDHDAYDSLK